MAPEMYELVHMNSQETGGLHSFNRIVLYFNINKFKVASISVWTKNYKICPVYI